MTIPIRSIVKLLYSIQSNDFRWHLFFLALIGISFHLIDDLFHCVKEKTRKSLEKVF